MKKVIAGLVVFAVLMGMFTIAQAAEVRMVLATGGTAGTYYPLGGAMAQIWNSKIPGMNVTAQTTGASAENVRLVNKGEAELALIQSDILDFAYSAQPPFKEKLTKMQAVAVLYPEIIQVVVRKDSPAKSIVDLKGMKVGVGAPGSGTEANFRQLLDVHGLSMDDIKPQYLSFSESGEQFKDNHIDAFIVTAGIPNAAIMDISTQNPVRLINIEKDKVQQLTTKYPFLSSAKVPGKTYTGLETDTSTVAVNAVLVVNSDVKEEVVYNLTKALFENLPELAAAHAKGKELSLQTAAEGVSIPFHPGAAKYFKEKGVVK